MTTEAPLHSPAVQALTEPIELLVIANRGEERQRIAAVLEAGGLEPLALVSDPEAIEPPAGTSTLLVFACDVDAPREIAELRRLRAAAAEAAVIAISPRVTGLGVRRALDAGADAVVFAAELERALVPSVHAVAAGQSVVPRRFRASVEKPVLSHREQEVLTLVRDGLTNAEIASRLFLAESTVKSHLASIFSKVGVRSRREAAASMIEPELTSPNGAAENGAVAK